MLCFRSPTKKRLAPSRLIQRKIMSCKRLVSWYSSTMISSYWPAIDRPRGVGVPSGLATSLRAKAAKSEKSATPAASFAAAIRTEKSLVSWKKQRTTG